MTIFFERVATMMVAVFIFALMTSAQTAAVASAGSAFQTAASERPVSQPAAKPDLSNIKIENFGQMDERYFRGAQPEPDDYASLAALGVKTVVDLRNDPTDYEKSAVEALGMKYVNIPMSGWRTPKMKDMDTFLALFDDPETGTVYVHCKAGRHRASVAGAAYRYMKTGWDYDQVYREMKKYRYSSGLVHGRLGHFVKMWGERLADEKAAELAASVGKNGTN
jgi:protein tyrosine/serine phosphatase